MYLPNHFQIHDDERIIDIISSYPFATLMSFDEMGEPFFSHVPLAVKKKPSGFSLLGHVAKRNPQWRHFQSTAKVKVIINGPQTYITPKWYRSGRDVPTWNYVAIHLDGRAQLIEDFDGLVGILKTLTLKFESGSKSPWEFELSDDLLTPETLSSAIVGFEIHVEKINAKFKLSQNRVPEDRQGIIEGLGQRTDEMSHTIAEFMRQYGSET